MTIEYLDAPFVIAKISGNTKEQREKICGWIDIWLGYQIKRGKKGCLIFDIDDTLITGHENPIQSVCEIFKKYCDIFPCYIVTARPDVPGNKEATEKMLKSLGLGNYKKIYLMPEPAYSGGKKDAVLEFKYRARTEILKKYETEVLARFGDQNWDVTSPQKNTEFEKYINTRDCCITFIPNMGSEVGIKLPGK
jgi:hypothetical protein